MFARVDGRAGITHVWVLLVGNGLVDVVLAEVPLPF